MLSRSAQSLYWIGRYLERAGHLCRLLRLQSEVLVDRPVREIHFGWNRIYSNVKREPPGGGVELFGDEEFALADSYILAEDLTFERSNPSSVYTCFALGRENARHNRQCISPEVWTTLNTSFLRLQQQDMVSVWRGEPRIFYEETGSEINTFGGLTESTMYHDEGWSFLQLGRYVERTLGVCNLLLSQIDRSGLEEDGEYYEADWTSLLRIFHAVEVYHHTHKADVVPDRVLDLLVSDPLLPESLSRSVTLATSEIDIIGRGPRRHSSRAVQRLTGRLSSLVNNEWPDSEDRTALLREVDEYASELHLLVTAAYFEYPVQERPSSRFQDR
jgi:uncharacterized alpha-E superfamily protein